MFLNRKIEKALRQLRKSRDEAKINAERFFEEDSVRSFIISETQYQTYDDVILELERALK